MNYTRLQASAAMKMRSAFVWDINECREVIQGSRILGLLGPLKI